MKVLVLNGPNLGSLGRRQPEIYGRMTLAQIHESLRVRAAELGVELRCEQSNSEGTLIDLIEEESGRSAALVINPGGLAHTSIALADAVRGFDGPVVEVHLSNIMAREEYRHHSHVGAAATAVIAGAGAAGYSLALQAAVQLASTTATETH
ncbi:MAG: type II 3-dehydroquinate dehydratase [Candidatus Dormibacteraeota bacterium]|nr:type II 3-dehydroquinate dehydratase [Candidatus Dormibacteraeota bacterium]